MRTFEILLILLALTEGVSRLVLANRRPAWISILPMLGFLIGIIHAAEEGVRIHMLAVYVIILGTFGAALARAFRTGDVLVAGGRRSRSAGLSVIAASAATLALAAAFPVYQLPPLSGDYVVGTRDIVFPDGFPGLRVYYPSDDAAGSPARLTEREADEHRAFLGSRYGLSAILLSHLALVETYAYEGIQLSRELPRYRILIEQPEPGHPSTGTVGLRQDLASRGFVVITALSEKDSTDTSDFDPEKVGEKLEGLRPDGPGGWLSDRLDLARIGLYGFGAAGHDVVNACRTGTFRAGAAIGSESRSTESVMPFMYFRPEEVSDTPLTDVNATTYVIAVRGLRTDNFGDDAFVSPLMPALGDFGSIAPERASIIVRDYLGAFFNKHLTRGTVERILDGPVPEFDEVSIQIHEADEDPD